MTIFDIAKEEGHKSIPEGKKGYFDIAKDYGKSILKGGAEGLATLGLAMSPTYTKKPVSEQLSAYRESLEEALPGSGTYGERAIQRGLSQAPTALASPWSAISTLPRALIAGFIGEGAKDLGAPEWAQSAAELTAYVGPDLTKKLLEKGADKALIAKGRQLGMSDEALTPLLQSEFKQKWLSKLSPRRGRTQIALERSKAEVQETYGRIAESEPAKKTLSDESSIHLIDTIENLFEKMPSGVRSKIKEDYKDLLKKDMTGESLINFWGDINYEMGKNSKQLSLLKDPIKKSLEEISPELAKDFESINALYSRFFPIAKKLEPNLSTDIISAAKALGMLGGVITGHYPTILEAAGATIAPQIMREMLINPRFQQIGHKIVDAMKKNNLALVRKLADLYKYEIAKISPEASEKIEFSDSDFENLLKHHKAKESKKPNI